MKYVKSKGREIRHFPAFVAGMSTHDYVRQYFELNAWRKWAAPSNRQGGPYGPNMVDIDALYILNQAPATLYDPATPEVIEEVLECST
jgi:hypothetical protein